MRKYKLTITLDSDVSPGSGDSIAGVVDHDITHEYGIPIIPAKRLKGALRGVAKEFVDWGFTSQCEVNKLFGEPGKQYRSGFKIYDAKLASIPAGYFENEEDKEIKDYNTFLAQIKQLDTAAKVLPLFTMLYTKTATENGQAQTGSLRTIRAINRGLVFKSIIELENEEQQKLLYDCVKGLRHLGYGRTRGLGEVTCNLTMIQGEPEIKCNFMKKENSSHQEEQFVNQAIRITLQQPTLLAGSKGLYYSCTDFVPGSALLGVFANLYIKKHNLGKDAHKNPEFERLFLRGGVSFGYAYPEVDEKVFMPCPAHIQRVKNENRAMLRVKKDSTAVLRKINSLAYMQENTNELLLHEPAKEFRMHHARPDNRHIGRAVNDTKGAEKLEGKRGQFYYYTALQKGQRFIGKLKGKQKDVQLLVSLLKGVNDTIHLGRSRTAEYGAAKVDVVNKEPHMGGFLKAKKGDNKVAIYLATPLTLQNEIGRYVADVELLIAQFEREIGAALNIEKMYIKETVLTGYNAKWRLPKQEKQALDAGTVLIVSTENKEVDWSLIEKQQWGTEIGEGFGEIQVLQYEDTPNELGCISMSKKLQGKQSTKIDHPLDCVRYIERAIEKRNKDTLYNKEAIHLAKEMLDELKQYSKSKIYQLEQYVRCEENNFALPKSFPDPLKDIGDKKLKNQTKVFIDAFFHTIKLEVRKVGKETTQK